MDNYFEANTGMKMVDGKLAEFNRNNLWINYKVAQKINEHLYRMDAMYNGGDCYVAGLAGARANDRLWTLGKPVQNNFFRNTHVSSSVLIGRARVKHARRRSVRSK